METAALAEIVPAAGAPASAVHEMHEPVDTHGAARQRIGGFLWRHRFLAAALVVNVVLVAALGRALVERHEMRLQKERAERQFAAVRKLAQGMAFDAHQALDRVPGGLAARKLIVDTTLAYLQRVSADAVDPLLRVELAAAYRRIGDIQCAAAGGVAGEAGGAMASYDHALALVEPLLAGASPARAAQSELALVAARKGALLMALGRWGEAETIGLHGLDAAQRLAGAPAAGPAEQRLLGMHYRLLTSLYQRAGQPKALAAIAAQAVPQLEKLVAARADDLDNVSNLAAIHAIRAVHLEQDVGTPEARHAALGEYYQSLAVMKAVYERHPTHRTLAADYGRVNRDTGLLLSQLGRPADALEYHRRAVEIATALAALDPGDARLRMERGLMLARLAAALRTTGDAPGGVAAAQQALALFDGLPEPLRDDVVVQYERAAAHLELGQALEAQAAARRTPGERRAELIAACVHHERARRLLDENLKRRPVTTAAAEQVSEADAAVARCGKV
jgi:non-specific serine/threonine protein kinase/serine/threonine-protein kinase